MTGEPVQLERGRLADRRSYRSGGLAGILVVAAIAGAAACTVVTFGVCGAVILGAVIVGGAVGAAITYSLSPGPKTPEGMASSVGWGAVGGAVGFGVGAAAGPIIGKVVTAVGSRAGSSSAGSVAGSGSSVGSSSVRAIIEEGKWDYIFGNVAEDVHNTARAAQNLAQMQRLGLSNTSSARQLLTEHFDKVASNSASISRSYTNEFGTFEVRESLFAGPSGALAKFETSWQVLPDGSIRFISLIRSEVNVPLDEAIPQFPEAWVEDSVRDAEPWVRRYLRSFNGEDLEITIDTIASTLTFRVHREGELVVDYFRESLQTVSATEQAVTATFRTTSTGGTCE